MKTGETHPTLNSEQLASKDVITIPPRVLLGEAMRLMARHGVRHLPVVDGERIVGMLSERDVLDALLREGALAQISGWSVDRVMRRDVFAVTASTEIGEALKEMREKNLSALPVIRDGKIVGIVTESDMLRALESMLTTRRETENDLVAESGSFLANHPLVQRVIKTLGDIGI